MDRSTITRAIGEVRPLLAERGCTMSPDVRLRALADGPAAEALADAGRQDPGAPTVGRVVTPPHRKSEKDAPDWYEEMYDRQRKVPSSRRIRSNTASPARRSDLSIVVRCEHRMVRLSGLRTSSLRGTGHVNQAMA
ncbi:hypothetical protein [Streptomyces sp. NPDC057496]|uniref:hypothetical protein n=1 Tax=Streptomyces sp. NPDC057496 TaxID=3346149 RepID=UPI003686CBAB